MEKVIHPVQQKEEAQRLPVLRLEMDYELMTLHDALVVNDLDTIKKSKHSLSQLREEWLHLTQKIYQ